MHEGKGMKENWCMPAYGLYTGCRWSMQEPGVMARIKYRRKKMCERSGL